MNESANLYVAVVDDDASLCRSLARRLRATGFHPVTFLDAMFASVVGNVPGAKPLLMLPAK